MKRKLILAFILILAVIITSCTTKSDIKSDIDFEKISIPENVSVPESDFNVRIIENGSAIEIIKYIGSIKNLNIPLSIENLPVTSIGSFAFWDNQLTGITIPNSVNNIGDYAFAKNQLTNVTIPNSVTNIGGGAFAENKLTGINIPNSVTSIGGRAFTKNQLTSVTIPNGVTTIEDWVFAENKLTGVTIPNSVTSIGKNAFYGNRLISISIPNSVSRIGEGAFMSMHIVFSNVTMSNNIISFSIGDSENNTSLISVTFEGTIPSDNFDTSSFPGDLRSKFYSTNANIGTPGTYTATRTGDVLDNNISIWTRQ